MNAYRLLIGTSAALALGMPALAQQLPTVVLINDSFTSGPQGAGPPGDDQFIRLDDLDGNGSYNDVSEVNLLFEFAPASALENYQLVDLEIRDENGAGVLYFSNNRSPLAGSGGGFFPQLLRAEDSNLSGRIEPSEVVELAFLETAFSAGFGQGAEGVAAHPDGSVWIAADFPGGGLLRWDNGVTQVFVDDNAGATFSTNQNGQLAEIDTDDFTALSWAGDGVISYIDGFGDDRTEAIFRFEDIDGDGAVNDDDELTPFMVPTTINPNWAANPDFGTVLRSLELTNSEAGMPGEPPFFVARVDLLTTTLVNGVEVYYFATSSSAANFGTNVNGEAINGLIFRGEDLNLDGDINDVGEVTLFFDGSSSGPNNLDKILGIDAIGGQVVAHYLSGASTPAIAILNDLDGDGNAEGVGEFQLGLWEDGLNPNIPVYEAFLFANRCAIAPGDLLERPLSQFAEISETGCAPFGPNVPRIGALGDPALGGSSLVVEVENGDPNEVALLMIGDGGPWLGIPIPVDLALIGGLPGCFLYQNIELSFVSLTDGQGAASFPISVPNNQQLDGIVLPMQAAVLRVEPAALIVSLTERMDVTLVQ